MGCFEVALVFLDWKYTCLESRNKFAPAWFRKSQHVESMDERRDWSKFWKQVDGHICASRPKQNTCTFSLLHAHTHAHTLTHTHAHTHTHVCTHTHTHVCTHTRIHLCTCKYIHTHKLKLNHAHTYTHTHTHTELVSGNELILRFWKKDVRNVNINI